MSPRPPTLRAQAAIANAMSHCLLRHALVLPSIDSLARVAGVSRMTMWKALISLRETGTLVALGRGRGFALPPSRGNGGPAPATESASRLSLEERSPVARALIADIVTGHFLPGARLPPYKTLTHRYGTCYTVLQPLLESFARQGKLTRHKRGYRVSEPGMSRTGATVAVIAQSTDMAMLSRVGTRSTEFWRLLEAETARAGIRVELLSIDSRGALRSGTGARHSSADELEARQRMLGYIMMPLGMEPAPRAAMVRVANTRSLPVALLDEDPEPIASTNSTSGSHTALYILGFGELPGYLVGNHLLALGHRHVAFLCHSALDPAYQSRLAGMRRAFAELGIGQQVVSVTSARWAGGIEPLHRMLIQSPPQRILDKAAVRVAATFSPGTTGQSGDSLTAAHREYVRKLVYETEAQQVFETALATPQISVWVTINDELALMAMRFLRSRSVQVPRDISVIGFDDSVEAFGAGLTSYNFNVAGLVRSMLGHVLDRRHRGGSSARTAGIEIPGVVIARSTSGTRVPRSPLSTRPIRSATK